MFVVLALFALLAVWLLAARAQSEKRYTRAFFSMSTMVDQKAYGSKAEAAMDEVEAAFAAFEAALSFYDTNSDIAAINAAAGGEPVSVKPQIITLLQEATRLSAQSDNAFAITLAPLSLAWGVTSDTPRVPTQAELDALLPLVNDADIEIDAAAGTVRLAHAGQAIDLGGIAKGVACNLAREIYGKNGVESAFISIGGNVYVHGKKPDDSAYRIGFRDPTRDASASIASFVMEDKVIAVSGGYERFFEQDGVRYHHILDPKTGAPAQSDIVSVGVIDADGGVADFYSTTLFVWGKEKALEFLSEQGGGCGILLDAENNLYVSKALETSFELVEEGYTVFFI